MIISASKMTRWVALTFFQAPLVFLALCFWASPGDAQELGPEEQRALSVTHAALQAITDEDVIALTDLMVEGAVMFALPTDGGSPRVTTRDQARDQPMTGDFVERGFDGQVRLTGSLATFGSHMISTETGNGLTAA